MPSKYLSTKPQILVFFTAEFPYGKGETFIEAEIKYLSDAFGEVIIIPGIKEGIARPVPANVVVCDGPLETGLPLFFLLRSFFSGSLWKELTIAKNVLGRRISWKVFKIAFKAMADSLCWAAWLKNKFPETGAHRYVFYTYWCDAKTLALTWLKSERKQDKFVTRLHGWDVYQERHNPAYLPFRKKMAEQLDAMVFISENGRKYVQRVWKLKNTDSLKLFRLGTRQPLPFYGEEKLHLVSCSGMIPLKRVGLIADAVISLKGQISWTHLGGGPLMAEMQTKINEAGAVTYITLLGNLPNGDVHGWFAGHPGGFFINVSETEGLPVSVMEAMSYAFPVIATDVGGTGEIVRNGVNGFLLRADPTRQEVADVLDRYIKFLPEERERIRQQAYNTWKEGYSAEKNFTEFACFLAQR